jgi:hypothetical protein
MAMLLMHCMSPKVALMRPTKPFKQMPKRLELLREGAPKAATVHILVQAGVLQDIPSVAVAAGKLGLAVEVVQAGTETEIDAAFTTLAREHARSLMVAGDVC